MSIYTVDLYRVQVQADLEKGLWSGNTTHTDEPPLVAPFVTAMLKGKDGYTPFPPMFHRVI